MCDDQTYYAILDNIYNLFNDKANQYQSRPLYVIFPYAIFQIIKNFTLFQNADIGYLVSFLLFQIVICIFTINLFINILKKYYPIGKLDTFMITLIYFLNPVQQFVVFTTSNGTLSFLMLVVTLYLLDRYLSIDNTYFLCLLIGLLFLMNRSFIVSLAVFLMLRTFNNRKKFRAYVELIIGFIIFWIPIYIYRYWIKVNGFDIYDTNVTDYGHFIWVSKYFDQGIGFWFSKVVLSRENFNLRLSTSWDSSDEWYCRDIPENFQCFFNDLVLVSIYLYIPVILVVLYLLLTKNISTVLIKNFFITSFITLLFWSFIGWYPPLRFGIYSFGNILFLLILIIYSKTENLSLKISLTACLFFSLINISHWNNPKLVEFTPLGNLGIVLLVLNISLLLKDKKRTNTLN